MADQVEPGAVGDGTRKPYQGGCRKRSSRLILRHVVGLTNRRALLDFVHGLATAGLKRPTGL